MNSSHARKEAMYFKIVTPSKNFLLNISSFSVQIMYEMAVFLDRRKSTGHELFCTKEIFPISSSAAEWHEDHRIIVP